MHYPPGVMSSHHHIPVCFGFAVIHYQNYFYTEFQSNHTVEKSNFHVITTTILTSSVKAYQV